MFLARRGKQRHRKEHSEDALTKERSHSALAQLSVPGGACKAKALGFVAALVSNARRLVQAPLQNIETRRRGVTITRGGPHRKTQRVERSVRSRSSFRRHVAVFRADFLYAEGHTVVALV